MDCIKLAEQNLKIELMPTKQKILLDNLFLQEEKNRLSEKGYTKY